MRLALALVLLLTLAPAAAAVTPARPQDASLLKRAATPNEQLAQSVAARLTRQKPVVRCTAVPLGSGELGVTPFVNGRPVGYFLLSSEVCAELAAFQDEAIPRTTRRPARPTRASTGSPRPFRRSRRSPTSRTTCSAGSRRPPRSATGCSRSGTRRTGSAPPWRSRRSSRPGTGCTSIRSVARAPTRSTGRPNAATAASSTCARPRTAGPAAVTTNPLSTLAGRPRRTRSSENGERSSVG